MGRQGDLLSYWVLKTYNPTMGIFTEVYKSHGQNLVNDKLKEYLGKGVCAVVEFRRLPLI